MTEFRESPSQTAGPYVHIGFMPEDQGITGLKMAEVGKQPENARYGIQGSVTDGQGTPVDDAVIEVFAEDVFFRVPTRGGFSFRVDRPDSGFLTLMIFARGINTALHTRMYFPDCEPDPCIPVERAATLVAKPNGDNSNDLRFDIRLQGEDETVFFDF